MDTSCSHARLGTGGRLTLTGYGLLTTSLFVSHYIRDVKLCLAYQRLTNADVCAYKIAGVRAKKRHISPTLVYKRTFGEARSEAELHLFVSCCL